MFVLSDGPKAPGVVLRAGVREVVGAMFLQPPDGVAAGDLIFSGVDGLTVDWKGGVAYIYGAKRGTTPGTWCPVPSPIDPSW